MLWIPKDYITESGLFDSSYEHLIPPVVPIYPKKEMNLGKGLLAKYYNETLQERIFDALNKTYVGFTRAVDEMYIFTPKCGEKANMKLEYFLAEYKNDSEANVFTMGEKCIKEKTNNEEAKAKAEEMPKYKVNNVELEYKVVDLYTNERCEQGIRLHNVLQRVKTIDDIDYALRYSKAKGIIPQEHYEAESKLLKEALNYDKVKWWFDKKNRVYNERSLLDDDGTITRPDRFITTPDGRTVVIDYKFGKKTPAKVKEYKEQVQGYMKVLRKVGMKNVEGYLWFPLEGNNDNAIEEVK